MAATRRAGACRRGICRCAAILPCRWSRVPASVIGGLLFGHAKPGIFTERSERGLAGLAAQAAVAIDNARLSHAAQQEIEERTRAEEALRDLNATLEQQVVERTEQLRKKTSRRYASPRRWRRLGQFTGGVAHDFNNLLQIDHGGIWKFCSAYSRRKSEGAAAGGAAGDERRPPGGRADPAFARLFPPPAARSEAHGRQPAWSAACRSCCAARSTRTIAVETIRGAALWRVEADPNELEAAILNLAVNARDAMAQGGRLTIETANSHLDAADAAPLTERPAGDYVVISVSDTGTGHGRGNDRAGFRAFFHDQAGGEGDRASGSAKSMALCSNPADR